MFVCRLESIGRPLASAGINRRSRSQTGGRQSRLGGRLDPRHNLSTVRSRPGTEGSGEQDCPTRCTPNGGKTCPATEMTPGTFTLIALRRRARANPSGLLLNHSRRKVSPQTVAPYISQGTVKRIRQSRTRSFASSDPELSPAWRRRRCIGRRSGTVLLNRDEQLAAVPSVAIHLHLDVDAKTTMRKQQPQTLVQEVPTRCRIEAPTQRSDRTFVNTRGWPSNRANRGQKCPRSGPPGDHEGANLREHTGMVHKPGH